MKNKIFNRSLYSRMHITLVPIVPYFHGLSQGFRCSGFRGAADATSFPVYSLFRRKDPGNSWSRGSQKIDCLRGCGESIILHASTSALYTSIARSECCIQSTLRVTSYVKILAKFDFCLLLNYKNMLNGFL
jgi:hypothetical protein